MDSLPNTMLAVAAAGKVRNYLLNADHPANRGKAALFWRFGFERERWQVLATALCDHVVVNEVLIEQSSAYGVKFVVQCQLKSPDGRDPCIRSIWIVEPYESTPRLVTAY